MAFTKIAAAGIGSTETVTVDGLTVINNGSFGGNLSVGGTLTYEDVTNVDSVGLITARNGIVVGSGITLSKDGDGFFTGVVTATSYAGDGSALTGIDATQIVTGNTSVQTVDTGSDGHVKVNTEGSERLRVGAGGSVGIGTDVPDTLLHLYGSSGNDKLITLGGGSSKRNNYIGITGSDNLEIGVDEDDEGSGSTFRIRIDGAEKARITSGGLLCVGHDSATGSGKIQASTAGQDGIDILGYNSTAGNGGRLTFYRSKNATIGSNTEVADEDSLGRIDWRGYNDDGTAFNIGATIEAQVDGTIDSTTDMPSALLFKTSADGSSSPSERLRLTPGGRVLINSTAARNISTNINRMLQIESSGGGAGLAVARNSDNAAGPSIDLGKSRGYPNTIVQSGDMLGQIRFAGADGTNLESPAAQIKVEVDGTPGENDMPGRIVFSTTADGAASPTEAMRITSQGYMSRPLHPNFCARHSGSSAAYSAQDVVIYNSVASNYRKWNIGGHYSTSTGKFTAPIDGIYYFEGQVMTIGWSNNDNIQDLIFLNSSQGNVSYPRQRRSYFRTEDDANGYFTNSCAGQVQLSAGQTVWIQLNKACSVTSEQFSYFTGWLVN